MNPATPPATPGRTFRIPPVVWVTAVVGLVAALVAVFAFKVAVGTVLTYGFFGLMMLSHLFMHGGHGSHGGHAGHGPAAETQKAAGDSNDSPAGHSGGCH